MKYALGATLLVVFALFSCIAPVKKIVVATDATFPPMEFQNEQKELVGFDIDLIKEVAKNAGLDIEIKSVAWDGIFAGLSNGAYDIVISSVTITDERKATYDFTNPYINAGQILVVPTASTATKLDELKGKLVGAQIGTTGAFTIEKAIGKEALKAYDEIGLAFEDAFNGKLAGIVIDTPVAAQYALQNAKYKGALKIVGQPMSDENYGIVVKKGNKELLDKLNLGLEKSAEKIAELKTKWLQ